MISSSLPPFHLLIYFFHSLYLSLLLALDCVNLLFILQFLAYPETHTHVHHIGSYSFLFCSCSFRLGFYLQFHCILYFWWWNSLNFHASRHYKPFACLFCFSSFSVLPRKKNVDENKKQSARAHTHTLCSENDGNKRKTKNNSFWCHNILYYYPALGIQHHSTFSIYILHTLHECVRVCSRISLCRLAVLQCHDFLNR